MTAGKWRRHCSVVLSVELTARITATASQASYRHKHAQLSAIPVSAAMSNDTVRASHSEWHISRTVPSSQKCNGSQTLDTIHAGCSDHFTANWYLVHASVPTFFVRNRNGSLKHKNISMR